MKTTVFLQSMDDYKEMNEVYAAMLPDPKPARSAVEVAKLPGNFLVEIEASEYSLKTSPRNCEVADLW